jgi:hypothetical protein
MPRKLDPFFWNTGIFIVLQTRKLGGNCWVMDQPHRIGPIVHWAKPRPTSVRAREHLRPQGSETPSQASTIRDKTKIQDVRDPCPRPPRPFASEAFKTIESETSESEALELRDKNLNPFE